MNAISRWAAVGAGAVGMALARGPAGAQRVTPVRDGVRGPLFTTADGWLTAGFAAGTAIAWSMDGSVARRLQLPGNQRNAALRNSATVFRDLAQPGAAIVAVGLWAGGRMTHHGTMAEVGVRSIEAIAASGVVGVALQGLAGRARPRVNLDRPHDFRFGRGFGADDYQSFPSGHVLAAFSLAGVVTAEGGRYWPRRQRLIGALTYTAAALSGVSRLYDNAHWASDVVLGAGIGTLSGVMTVRWNELHPGNWFDRTLLHLSAVPAPGGMDVGIHASW